MARCASGSKMGSSIPIQAPSLLAGPEAMFGVVGIHKEPLAVVYQGVAFQLKPRHC